MQNGIIVFDKVRFSVITENLIRCEHESIKGFIDNNTLFAINRKYNGCKYDVDMTEDTLTVSTENMSVTYKKSEGFGFDENNLYGTLNGVAWKYGDKNKENLGGTLITLDGVEGEQAVDDGILTKDGWFVYNDSNTLRIKDGWIMTNTQRHHEDAFVDDIYIFSYGNDYKKALKTLFYVSGKPALPRKYVLGSWYSRWWPYTDEEIIELIDEYDKYDFPLDIMVLDMDWHHNDWTYEDNEEGNKHKATYGYGHAYNLGWTGYTWNRNLIKNPRETIKTLHDRNIYVTLNDHPHDGIRTHEAGYEGFMRELGLDPNTQINLEFDLSSKKYMDAFFNNAHAPLEEDGVDFWWLDWQQDGVKPCIKGTIFPHLKWLNNCYFNHTEKNGKRGISYSRWAGFGDHKYPINFSGDTKSTWECLEFEVGFTASSSNAGLFYWGHDTGGFFGDRNPELYVRWTQFTAFSACLRVHSCREEELDRRPWKWGTEETAAMRKVYHMRSQLIPYIYTLAYNAYDKGEPLIKSMYIEHPEDENAYKNKQQYMFGDAFICAPVTKPIINGTASQKVWVKEGTYYNYFTNEVYTEGTYDINCPLDEFPLLIKGGMPIPMQPYSNRMTSNVLNELIIRCYPGEKGEFTLYEDDGITNEYKDDKNLKTRLSYHNEEGTITIKAEPFGNGYDGMPEKRDYTIELPLLKGKVELLSDTACDISYNDNCCYIKIKDKDIFETLEIILKEC